MKTPFTVDQFVEVFKTYNESVFPAQVLFYLIALATVFLVTRQSRISHRVISGILAFFWLWMGVVYHLAFFTEITGAAYFFGALFVLQSVLFLILGVVNDRLSFRFDTDGYGITGVTLIFFALFVYPVYGYFNGHVYPHSPTFGLPCPTTIFTFGVLLMTDRKVPISILIVPGIWSIIGFFAALSLGITEDFGLLAAGIVAASLLLYRNRTVREIRTAQ
jgi:hypothetical protein